MLRDFGQEIERIEHLEVARRTGEQFPVARFGESPHRVMLGLVLLVALLDAGISVVSIDYRLSPRHTMSAPMDDVARAVQFVRSKAGDWNLDPNRIAALGGSAGAHLGAWVALHDDLARPANADPVERQSSQLTCFVALWGPMDLTRVRPTQLAQQPLRGQDFANAFTAAFGCTAEQFEQDPVVRQRIRDASPLFWSAPTTRQRSSWPCGARVSQCCATRRCLP